MRKYTPIPIIAIMDERLSDSEFRLLSKLILKYGTESAKSGTVNLRFTDSDIGRLNMRKSTFYRLLSGLLKCEYLQRERDTGGYILQVPILRLSSPDIETNQSQIRDFGNLPKENEEESTKEEVKENDSNIYYNNNSIRVTENEKEKEIQKKEKDPEEKPKRPSKPFVKPTLEEVQAYCKERHSTVSAQAFYDWYESNGWMVGRNHMKDFRAAVRTWEAKDKAKGITSVPPENREEESYNPYEYPF